MAFKTKTISVKVLDGEEKFELRIGIDQNGIFSTYIPERLIELFKTAGIQIKSGRGRNPGYYFNKTLDGLLSAIHIDVSNYESLELIESKIIINYIIQTQCTYMLNDKKEIVPNGNFKNADEWREGTIALHAANSRPYGFLIYVKPFMKEIFKRKDGHEVIKYNSVVWNNYSAKIGNKKDTPNLYWLCNITSMSEPRDFDTSDHEIDYTEEVAGFFVDIIKGICTLNEKIKDFLDPESIQKLVNNKTKLLGMK